MVVIKRFTHYQDVSNINGVLDVFICNLEKDDTVKHWYYDVKVTDTFIYFIFRICR